MTALSISSGVVTIPCADKQRFTLNWSANITDWDFSFPASPFDFYFEILVTVTGAGGWTNVFGADFIQDIDDTRTLEDKNVTGDKILITGSYFSSESAAIINLTFLT